MKARALVLGWLWVLAIGIVAAAPPTPLQASCAQPELELIWSYPADGATGVPTNATFWVLTGVWGALPEATINGHEVSAELVTASGLRIVPNTLLPDTDYVLHLDYSDALTTDGVEDAGATEATLDIAFHTGGGPAGFPITVSVGSEMLRDESTTPPVLECVNRQLAAQGRLDTGPRVTHVFQTGLNAAIAWLVLTDNAEESALWPASCGFPEVSVDSVGAPTPLCFEIQPIGAGGVLGVATHFCSPAPAHTAGSSDPLGLADAAVPATTHSAKHLSAPERASSSCSVTSVRARRAASSNGAALPLLLAALALVLRKRATLRALSRGAAHATWTDDVRDRLRHRAARAGEGS